MADEEHLRLTEEIERLMETVSQKEQEIENLKTDTSFWGPYSMGSVKRFWFWNPISRLRRRTRPF
jgi:hypothetical protein